MGVAAPMTSSYLARKPLTLSRSAKSSATTLTLASSTLARCTISLRAFSAFFASLHATTTVAPFSASTTAASNPMPEFPPVMSATRFACEGTDVDTHDACEPGQLSILVKSRVRRAPPGVPPTRLVTVTGGVTRERDRVAHRRATRTACGGENGDAVDNNLVAHSSRT